MEHAQSELKALGQRIKADTMMLMEKLDRPNRSERLQLTISIHSERTDTRKKSASST